MENTNLMHAGRRVSADNPLPVTAMAGGDAKLDELNATATAILAELKAARYIDLPSGASVALATGTSYAGTIATGKTFILPTVPDATPHEIWLSLTATATASDIDWGTTSYIDEAPPDTLPAGKYLVGYLYTPSGWTVGITPVIDPS